MESIKSRMKEKITLMFERKDDESTDGESDSEDDEDDDEEEDQRKRIRYTNLAGRSLSHSLAPPTRTCSPPPNSVSSMSSLAGSGSTLMMAMAQQQQRPQQRQAPPAESSAASRALNFFRRKSDPRGTNQSRLRAEHQMAVGGQHQLNVPLIVHRRRSSIAMTK